MQILENICLAEYTSFKVGGNARYFAKPKNVEDILKATEFAKEKNIDYFFLGRGSNILVTDKGVNALCICLTKLNDIKISEDGIIAEAGASLSRIGKTALEEGLTGFEEIAGIPGSLGGGVFMNAGAYGREIADILEYTDYLDEHGEVKRLTREEHKFSYRYSIFEENPKWLILKSKFKLEPSQIPKIKDRMDELRDKRKTSQPLEYPSAGSTFKRPDGHYAGKLIEDTGLKGYTVGGAKISEKHAGFVINHKDATATEVLFLIDQVKEKVFKKFGVKLECEVRIIGDK